jgi:PAS domain S-box-containing protein
MLPDSLAQQIQLVRERLADLEGRAAQSGNGQDEVLLESLEELQTTVEELRAADEQLRAQTDELLAARSDIVVERERYRDLFESAPDVYLVTDEHGTIEEANVAAGRMFNIRPGFLVGKPLADFVPLALRRGFRDGIHQAIADGQRASWETLLLPRGLPPVHVALSTSPVRAASDATGLRWLIRDVTVRKQAEEEARALRADLERRVAERTAALEEANRAKDELLARERAALAEAEAAEQHFAFLAEASRALVLSLDFETTLQNVARLAIPTLADWSVVYLVDEPPTPESLGRIRRVAVAHVDPAMEELARELDQRFPLNDASGGDALRELALVLSRGQSVLLPQTPGEKFTARDPNEAHRALIEALGAAVGMLVPLIARGQMIGAIALFSGDSGRRYEADDLALAEELGRRAAMAIDNARLYQQAREAIRTRDSLLSALSHDLKNPLSIVKGYAQMARQVLRKEGDPLLERVSPSLEKIEGVVNRMTGQINELLELTRAQADRPITLQRGAADLVALARQVVTEYQRSNPEHRIRLESAVPSLPLSADVPRLERVLDNLLSNAVKFSPRGGDVFVQIEREDDALGARAVVRVRDHGLGIPAADLPRVFDLFHRAGNVAEAIPGTGIGLASVRQIVELHGGTIDVESTEGEGTTFIVRLPLGD